MPSQVGDPLVALKAISKSFRDPDGVTTSVLNQINLGVVSGDQVAVLGRSGSGKSTLLSIIGLLETPDSGSVIVFGSDVSTLGDRELAYLRGRLVGFVYQRFFLLDHLSSFHNVELALLHGSVRCKNRRKAVLDALDQVGLATKHRHRPRQLSGGEQQRVAIARALVKQPQLILADEPTGALDVETSEEVLRVLLRAASELSAAVVAVTHDPVVAERLGTTRTLHQGRWVEEASC